MANLTNTAPGPKPTSTRADMIKQMKDLDLDIKGKPVEPDDDADDDARATQIRKDNAQRRKEADDYFKNRAPK